MGNVGDWKGGECGWIMGTHKLQHNLPQVVQIARLSLVIVAKTFCICLTEVENNCSAHCRFARTFQIVDHRLVHSSSREQQIMLRQKVHLVDGLQPSGHKPLEMPRLEIVDVSKIPVDVRKRQRFWDDA